MKERLRENLDRIRTHIRHICEKHHRNSQEIRLVVVTKTIPAEVVRELMALDVQDLGENRVQEAKEKIHHIKEPFCWHMIGHLQTNKVKTALEIFSTIHSVDSLKLAQAINQQAEKVGKKVDVFLEVNTSGEEAKWGLRPEEVESVLNQIEPCQNIRMLGLMTMAPLTDDAEWIRSTFKALHNMRLKYNSRWKLSMGMSHDYPLALEEGADILRIGSAVFEGVLETNDK